MFSSSTARQVARFVVSSAVAGGALAFVLLGGSADAAVTAGKFITNGRGL